MTDIDLRALERAAVATPTDAAAGLALASALERAGRRRDAFLERCRVAHAGSDVVIGAVERAARQVAGGDLIADLDVSAPPEELVRAGVFEPTDEEITVFGCGERLVLRVGPRLIALREDLSTVWDVEDAGGWAVACDDAVVHSLAPGRIALRRGSDGTIVAEADLGFTTTQLVASWGDRLVLGGARTKRGALVSHGIDLGHAFGRVTWSRDLESDETVAGGARLALRTMEGPIEVLAIDDGRTLARVGRLSVAPRSTGIRPLAQSGDLLFVEAQEQLGPGPRGGHDVVLVAMHLRPDGQVGRAWRHELIDARGSDLQVDSTGVLINTIDLSNGRIGVLMLGRADGTRMWSEHTANHQSCILRGSTVIGSVIDAPRARRSRLLDAATATPRAECQDPGFHHGVVPIGAGLAYAKFDGEVRLVTWPRRIG